MMPSSCNGSFSRMATNVPTPSPVFSWRRMRSRGGGVASLLFKGKGLLPAPEGKAGAKTAALHARDGKKDRKGRTKRKEAEGGGRVMERRRFFFSIFAAVVFFFSSTTHSLCPWSHISFLFFLRARTLAYVRKQPKRKQRAGLGLQKKKNK